MKKFQCVPIALALPAMFLIASIVQCDIAIRCFNSNDSNGGILFIVMAISAAIFAFATFIPSRERVEIGQNKIVYKRFYSKDTFYLEYNKCIIGMDYHIQNGNKIWWIYLCYGKMPPYKNPHLGNRINSIQCQPGFIRIMYREEVYNALIEVLPKNQKTALITARRYAGFEKQGRIF